MSRAEAASLLSLASGTHVDAGDALVQKCVGDPQPEVLRQLE